MHLSIVTTIYCSAPYLAEFHARATLSARGITDDYEMVFINDGSPDDSLAVMLSLYEQDEKVRVIDLSRNFGHHKAMMAGLAHAKGDLVFLIDCDLEVAPETLTAFHARFCSTQTDVVYGVQDERKDGLMARLAGRMFYTIFNWFSTDALPVNLLTTRLMSRRYVSALIAHEEREILIAGLWAITGFSQVPLMVPKLSKGKSTYTLGHRIAVLVNAITSFSNKPLIMIFYLGIMISLASGLAAFYLVIRMLLFGTLLEGWPSLIVSVWMMGGLSILCLGIVGIYLSKIYMETKQRPNTIIREIYQR